MLLVFRLTSSEYACCVSVKYQFDRMFHLCSNAKGSSEDFLF